MATCIVCNVPAKLVCVVDVNEYIIVQKHVKRKRIHYIKICVGKQIHHDKL